jgi:hypothetical protein
MSKVLPLSKVPPSDRNLERRYQADDPVEVVYEAGASIRLSGRMRNVSRTALCLELGAALGRTTQIRITFQGKLVIVGEVCECTPNGDGFRMEVSIHDLISSSSSSDQHVHDDQLSLYIAGKGLTVPDFTALGEHFVKCAECLNRLKRLTPGA